MLYNVRLFNPWARRYVETICIETDKEVKDLKTWVEKYWKRKIINFNGRNEFMLEDRQEVVISQLNIIKV